MAVISQRFHAGLPALTVRDVSFGYKLPIRMVNRIGERLQKAGLVNFVVSESDDNVAITPAVDTTEFTVGNILKKIDTEGNADFIPGFKTFYSEAMKDFDKWFSECYDDLDKIHLNEISLPEVTTIEAKPVF